MARAPPIGSRVHRCQLVIVLPAAWRHASASATAEVEAMAVAVARSHRNALDRRSGPATALIPAVTRRYSSGLLNFAAHSPEDCQRDRRYGSARLEWTVPKEIVPLRRISQLTANQPQSLSVTGLAILASRPIAGSERPRTVSAASIAMPGRAPTSTCYGQAARV